jgi:hypothetical protein
MTYVEAILKVLVVGLVLGAGLPAIFAVGLVSYSSGVGGANADGSTSAPNPALRALGLLLFLVVAAVIVVALLWITRTTMIHHFGFDPFPGVKKG